MFKIASGVMQDVKFLGVVVVGLVVWFLTTLGCASDQATPKSMPVTEFQQSVSDYTKKGKGLIILFQSGVDKKMWYRQIENIEDLRMSVTMGLDESQLSEDDQLAITNQMKEVTKSFYVLGAFRSTTGSSERDTERLDELKVILATITKISEGRTRLASNSSKDTQ